MSKLVSLVKKLLERKPDNCGMFCDYVAYKHKDGFYRVDTSEYDKTYSIYLFDTSNETQFSEEVSERDYMEIKWAIEEWRKILHEDAFDEFEEFVNEVPDQGMDELLHD